MLKAPVLEAGADLVLTAGGDLTLTANALAPRAVTADRLAAMGYTAGTVTGTETRYDRPWLTAGNNAVLQSTGGLLTLDGAQLEATGGSLSLQGLGVGLLARKDVLDLVITQGQTTRKPSNETLVGAGLWAKGDISVLAHGLGVDQGDLLSAGSEIQSRDGHVALLAARNLTLANDITTDRYYERFYDVRRRLFSRKVVEHIKSSIDEQVEPGVVEGRSVSLGAGGQLDIVASSMFADGALSLHADGDLNLLSKAEHHYAYESRTVKKSGLFSNGGLSITLGSQSKTTITEQDKTLQHGASLGSLAGDIRATAGGQYLQLSSDLTAPQGDVAISAANVALRSAPETTSVLNIVRQRQSGLTLSASHPVIDSLQTAARMASIARRTDNGRYQAMALLTAGLSIYNNYADLKDLSLPSVVDGKATGGWTLGASLGASSSSFESLRQTSTPVGPAITTGRNLSVTATGSGADSGDITLVGARLSAGGDATLRAARDITLAAAIGTSSDTSKSRSSSGAVGVSIGAQGASLTLAASRSNGWSNGWGTTYYNSEVGAAGRLSLDSGAHVTLQGAKASGQSVALRVGSAGAGNLTLSSPQDADHYVARESSSGFNVSVPLPVPVPGLASSGSFSFGVNRSGMNLLAEYEAVREQTAINAGTGGFDITVNGHTHLKGGAITSEGPASSSQLVTQSLSHETLLNRDVVEGRSWSVAVSVSDRSIDPATGKERGALAGSTVGYARVATDQRSHTASAVVGSVTQTRPDLQAQAVARLRAAEREPLAIRLADVQARLAQLLASEPAIIDPCPGCGFGGGAGVKPSVLSAGGGMASLSQSAQPAQMARSTQALQPVDLAKAATVKAGDIAQSATDWASWNTAVQALRSEQTKLQQRIAEVDSKAYQSSATLAASASALHQPLLQTFDRSRATQELKDGVAVTAAFGKAAFKAVGDLAQARVQAEQEACKQPASAACAAAKTAADGWREGERYKVVLHGIVGAVAGGKAGAIATATTETASPTLAAAVQAAGFTPGTATFDMLMLAAKSAVGAGLGGAQGAAAAFNADANNRQLHVLEVRTIREQAARFARQVNGGWDPTAAEVSAAEKRLADEAYRQVQFGADGATDVAALNFLRSLPRVLLPGDPGAPGQNVGYAFYATPDQRANLGMYADGLLFNPEVQSFYISNRLAVPSQAQVLAVANRNLSGRELTAALTKAAGLGAGGLALGPTVPVALTACLANITLCAIQAAEIAAGGALGPTGMGTNLLAARAGVKGVLTAEQANAQWLAQRATNTAAWPEGTVVLQGEINTGTRMRMYMTSEQAEIAKKGETTSLGGWATFDEPAASIYQIRQQLALAQDFKPTAKGLYVVELEVVRPMAANIGFVGPQAGAGTANGTRSVEPGRYVGGGTQIQFMDYLNRGSYVRVVAPPKCIEGC